MAAVAAAAAGCNKTGKTVDGVAPIYPITFLFQ